MVKSLIKYIKKKGLERKLKREVPLFLFNISFLVSYFPLQKAIEKASFGKIGKIFGKVLERYRRSGNFEEALKELEKFPCLEELREVLKLYWKTGNSKIIEGLAEKSLMETKREEMERGARLGVFSSIFIVVSTVLPVMGANFVNFMQEGLFLVFLGSVMSLLIIALWEVSS